MSGSETKRIEIRTINKCIKLFKQKKVGRPKKIKLGTLRITSVYFYNSDSVIKKLTKLKEEIKSSNK